MNSDSEKSRIGAQLLYYETLASTNVYALEYISKNSPKEGLVVYTYNQTAGLGQYGREWHSAPGKNLAMSVVLKPDSLNPSKQFMLSMFASISLNNVLASTLNKKVRIKWPNDILVKENKIAGILIQNVISNRKIKYCVIGIGVNVNQENFPKFKRSATSCKLETGDSYSRVKLRSAIIDELNKHYDMFKKEDNFKSLREKYLIQLYGIDQELQFKHKLTGAIFKGIIRSIDEFGRLIVEVNGKNKLYNLREITY